MVLDLSAFFNQFEKEWNEQQKAITPSQQVVDMLKRCNEHTIYKVEASSYWGMVKGDEIIYCIRFSKASDRIFRILFPLQEPSSLEICETAAGKLIRKNLPENAPYVHIAFIEKTIDVTRSKLSMWQRLYDKNHFKYWRPECGPFAHTRANKTDYLSFFRVYQTSILLKDLTPTFKNGRTLTIPLGHSKLFTDDILAKARPILDDDKFKLKVVSIIETMK